MSNRADIYEKYKKSDIFNLNPISNNNEAPQKYIGRNLRTSSVNNRDVEYNTIETRKSVRQRRIPKDNDIFNLNRSFDNRKIRNNRRIINTSTCFDSMKDNTQFANDIKDYTSKKRAKIKEYNPDKYLPNENASERLYNQLYDKKRNPIIPSANKNNVYSNNDLNNAKDDKTSFLERKKNMNEQFIKPFFNQRNEKEIKKTEKETEQGEKLHKFNKAKGFTYNDNEGKINNTFITPDNYPDNSSKINKQIQLQSNIFPSNENENNIDKIKERIENVQEEKAENREKKEKNIYTQTYINKSKNEKNNEKDKNIWGTQNSNWEQSNLDWKDANTELIFSKTYSGKDEKNLENNKKPFQKKIDQLQDSGYKDTINESAKTKKEYDKNINKEASSNLEQINEILDDNALDYDKKRKILFYSNTTGLNGETNIDPNITNYNKYHKNMKKNKTKQPTIKIMSKEGGNSIEKRKNLDKNFNNVKAHDDFTIHDYVLSYDSKGKNTKNNFDQFNENDIKLLFNKKGIHIYNIQKSHFDNGKYNTIKFKIRENEGENNVKEKMKEIENDCSKKNYNICIEKDVEKEKKKKKFVNIPGTKEAMLDLNNDNKNLNKKKEPLQVKNNARFTGKFNMANNSYKKNS